MIFFIPMRIDIHAFHVAGFGFYIEIMNFWFSVDLLNNVQDWKDHAVFNLYNLYVCTIYVESYDKVVYTYRS